MNELLTILTTAFQNAVVDEERSHIARTIGKVIEDADLVLCPGLISTRNDPEILHKIQKAAPSVACLTERSRIHQRQTQREVAIARTINDCLPHSGNTIPTIKARFRQPLRTSEILLTLRKATQFDWEVYDSGTLHIDWRNPSLAQRIRRLLSQSPRALTRREIESALLEGIPHAKLHYALTRDESIIRLDRDLFGLEHHQGFTLKRQQKAEQQLIEWLQAEGGVPVRLIIERLRSEASAKIGPPLYRYEIIGWLDRLVYRRAIRINIKDIVSLINPTTTP